MDRAVRIRTRPRRAGPLSRSETSENLSRTCRTESRWAQLSPRELKRGNTSASSGARVTDLGQRGNLGDGQMTARHRLAGTGDNKQLHADKIMCLAIKIMSNQVDNKMQFLILPDLPLDR